MRDIFPSRKIFFVHYFKLTLKKYTKQTRLISKGRIGLDENVKISVLAMSNHMETFKRSDSWYGTGNEELLKVQFLHTFYLMSDKFRTKNSDAVMEYY